MVYLMTHFDEIWHSGASLPSFPLKQRKLKTRNTKVI